MASIEECLRKKDTKADEIKYKIWFVVMVIAAAGAFIGVLTLFYNTILGAIVTVIFGGIAIFAYFRKENSILEYDYAFYEDVITIARVSNQRRRKELIRVELPEIECIAPVYDDRFKPLKNISGLKVINATLNGSEHAYFIDCVYNKSRTCVLWEPSEALLKAVRSQKPRAVRL